EARSVARAEHALHAWDVGILVLLLGRRHLRLGLGIQLRGLLILRQPHGGAAALRLAHSLVEIDLRAEAEADRITRADVLVVPVRALADLLDGGLGSAEQLGDRR